jgi:hypothetical protein
VRITKRKMEGDVNALPRRFAPVCELSSAVTGRVDLRGVGGMDFDLSAGIL